MATNKNKNKCPRCGKFKIEKDYYMSKSPLYQGNNSRMAFCKECLWDTYDNYYKILKDIKSSIYITCLKYDIPFKEPEFEGMLKEYSKKENGHPLKIYMTKINSLGAHNNDLCDFDPISIGLISKLNCEEDDEEENSIISNKEKDIELTEADEQVKQDVIRLMGYDPFAGYSKLDQKYLYNELIPYLDEDTLDDNFKLSQIMQLVNNNHQIRKIDLIINNLSSENKSLITNQGAIKSLQQTKYQIVQATDKIAKENSISVKNRGDSRAGKSTLTYMMKNLRELGFEDAEQDYYDQKKAFGMKRTADISNRSILEQLQFDENDYVDIIKEQRELLITLQEKNDDLEEENRQLHVKLLDK